MTHPTMLFDTTEHVLIAVHGREPPSDEDWESYMQTVLALPPSCSRTLVVTAGGGPNANEYCGDCPFARDEVGLVAHRRGTVGISTRGRDTGDSQIFVNLVDSPRLDHTYTVFAYVCSGMSAVESIQEGERMKRLTVGKADDACKPE